mmetsp:Transcript_54094/g.161941  ORF Transcript_54094/g.161941 Transcript_54094/m.161941 type:complete len:203 (+) Transcript_54094:603-1211(+)
MSMSSMGSNSAARAAIAGGRGRDSLSIVGVGFFFPSSSPSSSLSSMGPNCDASCAIAGGRGKESLSISGISTFPSFLLCSAAAAAAASAKAFSVFIISAILALALASALPLLILPLSKAAAMLAAAASSTGAPPAPPMPLLSASSSPRILSAFPPMKISSHCRSYSSLAYLYSSMSSLLMFARASHSSDPTSNDSFVVSSPI